MHFVTRLNPLFTHTELVSANINYVARPRLNILNDVLEIFFKNFFGSRWRYRTHSAIFCLCWEVLKIKIGIFKFISAVNRHFLSGWRLKIYWMKFNVEIHLMVSTNVERYVNGVRDYAPAGRQLCGVCCGVVPFARFAWSSFCAASYGVCIGERWWHAPCRSVLPFFFCFFFFTCVYRCCFIVLLHLF